MPGPGGSSTWVEQENFNQIEFAINQLQISVNDLSYQVGRILSALNRATLEIDRDAAAHPLFEGHFDRRFFRGARGVARQGRSGAVASRHCPSQGWLGRRARCLAETRSVDEALRLRLGGRHSTAGPARRREAVHSGVDRRDARGNAKSSSASPTGRAKVRRIGAICCSI